MLARYRPTRAAGLFLSFVALVLLATSHYHLQADDGTTSSHSTITAFKNAFPFRGAFKGVPGALTAARMEWHQTVFTSGEASSHSRFENVPKSDPCAGWDYHDVPANDPPNCRRARQFRQMQRFREVEDQFNMDQITRDAIDHVERCILGVLDCPDYPLIISDSPYMQMKFNTGGETIWLLPIMKAAEELNFRFWTFHGGNHAGLETAWNATRLLNESLHSYWTEGLFAMNCLQSPGCVRPEDVVPAKDPKFRHDVSIIPPERLGVLPSWKVFTVNFWGSKNAEYGGPGLNPGAQFGIPHDWSFHPLGKKWQFVPYPYDKHTYLPISIEQRCLRAKYVPYEEKDNSAIFLAKFASYFHEDSNKAMHDKWGDLAAALKAYGPGYNLIAPTQEKDGVGRVMEIPDAFDIRGTMSSVAYSRMLSRQKAIIGIGQPIISPSPYIAMCLGVPAVMPYFTDKGPQPDHHPDAKWGSQYVQHGHVSGFPEPYVYNYNMSDPDDLIRQLKRAVSTPIPSYIPAEMTLQGVRAKVREVLLETDWEGEYRAVIAANGGVHPHYPDVQIKACWEPYSVCKGILWQEGWDKPKEEEKKE